MLGHRLLPSAARGTDLVLRLIMLLARQTHLGALGWTGGANVQIAELLATRETSNGDCGKGHS